MGRDVCLTWGFVGGGAGCLRAGDADGTGSGKVCEVSDELKGYDLVA